MPDLLNEERSPRIAIVRRSSLGDVINDLPVLVALRRHYPDAYLAWVVERRFADVLRGHECLDELIEVPERPWQQVGRILDDNLAVGRILRQRRVDLAIDMQGRTKSWLTSFLSGARRRVGIGRPPCVRLGWPLIREFVPISRNPGILDRVTAMLAYLQVPAEPLEFRYPVLPAASAWAEEFLSTAELNGRPLVGLVLGTAWENKAWPPEHFARLAELVQVSLGAQVVLLGGGREADREARIQQHLPAPVPSTVGRTTLPQLAALLHRCQVVVAGDTGGLHMAAVLGRSVVGLYGPTSPLVNGPYGQGHRILWDNLPCSPCRHQPTCKDYHCMRNLTPERVAEAVAELLVRDPLVEREGAI